MKTVLIDGDVLLYETAFSSVKSFNVGDDWYQTLGDLKEAKSKFNSRVEQIKEASGSGQAVVLMSDDSKRIFRLDFFPEYKANRRNNNIKPPHFKALKQWILGQPDDPENSLEVTEKIKHNHSCYTTEAWPHLEADDLIGIRQTQAAAAGKPSCISSVDKDLYTIPGEHCHLNTLELRVVHPEQARRQFILQCLMGDATDNIPGIKGVGIKTAEKILNKIEKDDPSHMWEAIVAEYEKKGHTEDDALETARLVYILQKDDHKNGEPILWAPELL